MSLRILHRPALVLAGLSMALCAAQAQSTGAAGISAVPDFSVSVQAFPHIWRPYKAQRLASAELANGPDAPLPVQNGKVNLSMRDLLVAVVENNLTVANARYYPAEAKIDLMRARSGASPRGVDASVIPSAVFAGAAGASILASGGGFGGGVSSVGSLTGAATAINIRPSGVFDPNFNATLSFDHTTSPLNSLVVTGVPTVTNNTVAASFSYSQLFPTGTSLAASYTAQRQASTQLRLQFNPYYSPGFSASVSQELGNGFGIAVNRALITVAENEQAIERESFRQQLVTAMAGAQNAYWDLISARESVRVARQALAVAQQLQKNNQAEFDAGVMAKLDVDTATAQVAASQRDLTVAQANVQYAELNLKSMISENLDEPLAAATVDTADSFPDPSATVLPSLSDAVAIAQKNRPEIAVAEGNIKSQQDVAPFLKSELRPTFDAFGEVSTVGLYNFPGTAFTEAIQFKYPQWAVGISINFSVHNRQAQADNVRSRLEMRQSQDTLVKNQNQVETDVLNALTALRQGKSQIAAAQEAVRLNQLRLDAENEKLSVGLSTSYNVILVQRDLFSSQLAEVQARDTFAKALVALDQAEGMTLDRNHISLDDAIRGRVSR